MKIKALFTDLDRTLLTHEYKIHPRVLKAFASAKETGLRIVIVTARAPKSLQPYAAALGNDGLVACYNGAWIGNLDTGDVLSTSRLERTLAHGIMENAKELGAEPVWYDDGHIGVHTLTEGVIQQLDRVGEKAVLMSSDAILWNAPYKIMCVDRRENTAFDAIEKLWSAKASVAQSHKALLEIGPATSSKGMAIDFIGRHLSLNLSECAAAGNSFNDIPMLKAAGFAYAVRNAVEEVKQIASFVGGSCDEGGLADIIETVLAINQKT